MELIVWLMILISLASAKSCKDVTGSCGSEKTICPGGHHHKQTRIGVFKEKCYLYDPIPKTFEVSKECNNRNMEQLGNSQTSSGTTLILYYTND